MKRPWTHRYATSGRPFVIAHRGASALAPENTAASFETAFGVGADSVETDVRLTADGVPVCAHDADLRRLQGDPRRIESLRLSELWEVAPMVPTLSEALRVTRLGSILLDVKLALETDVMIVVSAVLAAEARERTLLGLRNPDLARAVSALPSRPQILAFAADPDSAAEWHASGASWFRLWQGALTTQRVEAARALGMGVAVMTGDPGDKGLPVGQLEPTDVPALLAYAPDAVLLDDPRLLV